MLHDISIISASQYPRSFEVMCRNCANGDNAMKMIFRLVLGLMSVAFLFKEIPAQMSQAQEKVPVSVKELRNAPAEIVLDGKSLSLSAYLWRDFSPGTWGNNGSSPLMASLKVTTSDKKAFPSGVRMERAWVLFGEQIWEVPDFRFRGRRLSDNKEMWIMCSVSSGCEISFSEGPQWGPGVFVDVVVRLIDKEGNHHLIQAKKQHIIATS